jgi:3-dehydroquinate dehydratase II
MHNILVINGPNLNLLGTREIDVYGTTTLDDINGLIINEAAKHHLEVEFFQSNHEGKIIDKIHNASGNYDCIIINPAAYTHYSIAIRDALIAIDVPAIEVHLSNIHSREEFRQKSVTAPVAIGQISGFGPDSYLLAVMAAASIINRINNPESI